MSEISYPIKLSEYHYENPQTKVFVVRKTDSDSDKSEESMKALNTYFHKQDVSFLDNEEDIRILNESESNIMFFCNEFKSEFFELIHQKFPASWIIGLRAFVKMLEDDLPIYRPPPHIHNFTFYGKSVMISNKLTEKAQLGSLIHFMGGFVQDQSMDLLITDDPFDLESAHSKGVTTILPALVDKIWEINHSCEDNVTDLIEEAEKQFRFPIFYKIGISSTGFDKKEIENIKKLVEDNGGDFRNSLSKNIQILIVNENKPGSEKHKKAFETGMKVLNVQWLKDSIEKGYPINDESLYFVKYKSSSTPIKKSAPKSLLPSDVSNLSIIPPNMTIRSEIDGTILTEHNPNRTTRSSMNVTSAIPKIATKSFRRTVSKISSSHDRSYQENPGKFLTGKTVCVLDNDKEIKKCALECGATIVNENFKENVDYVISKNSFVSDTNLKILKYSNFVNIHWFEDSKILNKRIKVEDHHRALKSVSKCDQVLKGELFVITNYRGSQYNFVRTLIFQLGGEFKETLMKSEAPIVLSPTPEGKKFESALLWGLTILSADWLMKCYNSKIRADESEFLIGNCSVSKKNIKPKRRMPSIIPSSQEILDNQFNYSAPLEFNSPFVDLAHDRFARSMDSPLSAREKQDRKMKSNVQTPGRAIPSRKLALPEFRDEEEDCKLRPIETYDENIRKLLEPIKDLLYRDSEIDRFDYDPPAIRSPLIYERLPLPEPYEVTRYLYYKRVIPGYSSPDPRLKYKEYSTGTEKVTTPTATDNSLEPSNFFGFDSENLIGMVKGGEENSLIVPEN